MFNGEGGSAMTIVKAQMLAGGRCRIPVDQLVLHAAIENGSTLVLCDHTGILPVLHKIFSFTVVR